MQTGHLFFFLIFPISSEACCGSNHQNKRKGRQQNMAYLCYKAVEGEIFMMPCIKSDSHQTVKWYRAEEGNKDVKGPSIDCGRKFPVEKKHSGKYICPESKLSLHLQVVKKSSLGCSPLEKSSVLLQVGAGKTIQCPCFNGSDQTDVTWYKGVKAVSEQKRASCEENGALHLCEVSAHDSGVYFCDRQITEHGVQCTFRRTVNATAVPYYTPSYPPRIMYPDSSTAEEVELGQSHTLTCKVYFPSEETFPPAVKWFKHHGGNLQNKTLLSMTEPQQEKVTFQEYKVTRRSIIKEVTPQHLNDTYTCIATNSVGNSSVTIKLKRKTKVKWPSLVGYPIATLLLVGGLGLVVHVKWLEMKLIYRSRLQHNKHNRDRTEEKEFDVFLSFVWSDSSAMTEGVWALSTRPGYDTDEEGHLSRFGLLTSKEGNVTHRPLEVLLPQVLEDRWGYRLCLLERDVLPGGAYTNDVVHAIRRSRMLICLLSAEYLSNSDAVFVLESGVQALLHNACPKLLLIWTDRESAPYSQTDPPLPVLVQRALKVLPSLCWTSDDPSKVASKFWRCLRKTMPDL